MATIIAVFILLCFAHYYIETVIIPIELKSFSLKLDNLIAELDLKKTSMPNDVYVDLRASIISIITTFENNTFSDFLTDTMLIVFNKNMDKNKVVLKHESTIANDISARFHKIVWSASLTSCLGLIFYFVPILMVISLINFLYVAMRVKFKILSVRAKDLFFPSFFRHTPSIISASINNRL